MLRTQPVKKGRSNWTIVRRAIDVKTWQARIPSVDEVRPAQCPRCAAASRPVGRSLQMWGHGLRERQSRGPLEVTLRVRRYVCLPCRAVIVVVPLGMIAGRLFTAMAIGLALAEAAASMPDAAGRALTVDWFNKRRLLEPIGNVPPAEFEEQYYRSQTTPTEASSLM